MFTGYLGSDAVIKLVNGKNVLNFSVAHTEKWWNAQNTLVEKTTWIECAWWKDETKVAQHLKRGAKVFVSGKPEARAYIEKVKGAAMGVMTCRVNMLEIIAFVKDSQESQAQSSSGQTQQPSSNPHVDPSDITEPVDDLPF